MWRCAKEFGAFGWQVSCELQKKTLQFNGAQKNGCEILLRNISRAPNGLLSPAFALANSGTTSGGGERDAAGAREAGLSLAMGPQGGGAELSMAGVCGGKVEASSGVPCIRKAAVIAKYIGQRSPV